MTTPAPGEGHRDGRSVRIVGTGLIGASLGLALTAGGYRVALEDASPTAAALARDLGAGRLASEVTDEPDLVVVAAPPDVVARVVAEELKRWPHAVVTDVASVKSSVLAALAATGADLGRYVGSHPMAGRERSGAIAAQADLFDGRAWVVAPGPQADPGAVAAVRSLGEAVGAAVTQMSPEEHDAAVAAVSHVPQVAASLVAGRLRDLPASAVALSGQGIRDVTRIAASDPAMWTQILAANAPAVRAVLLALRADLDGVLGALEALGAGDEAGETSAGAGAGAAAGRIAGVPERGVGARAVLARAVAEGNTGHARIPGKHGAAPTTYATVAVVVPDEPGALARLLHDVGQAGINLEDLHLEHGLGQPVGLAELSVLPAAQEPLTTALAALGWRVHD
ncbi:prephenate dehydrogenase [Oryzihumus sp.]|uniref:prephenate dehydrogenase n=1 Tax=Oryzihumus sp. TaxID=1968903 RepID=UPI002ED87E21